MQFKGGHWALKVALIYLIVSGAWILFSDKLVASLVSNPDDRLFFSIIKGLAFVVLMAGALYHLLRRWEQEVEQRRQAEANLHPTERALRTLNDCNQALVRAASEPALLQEICRVLVEQGGYRLALVGFAVNDKKKSVRFAGHAGYDESYLEQLQVTWADAEQGRGPVGTAIRTGQIAVCNNSQTDANFAPWRAAAVRHGYASVIALPLRDGGKIFGVLALYAATTDAFNATEVEFLKELADDLAYGIRALRTRLEHALAEKEVNRLSQWLLKTQEISKVGGWAINLKTDAVWVSPESRRIYGSSGNEPITLSHIQSYPLPQYRPRLDTALRELVAGRQPYDIEFQISRGTDGAIVDIHSQAEYNAEEAVVLGFIEDITERKRAEAALRESQTLYHSLVTQLPVGIFRKDQQGRFVLVNPGFCQLKGMNAEEFLGKTPVEVSMSEAAKKGVIELLAKYAAQGEEHHRLIMQTGKSIELDEAYSLADGRKLFLHVMKFPVLDPEGKIIGSQGVLLNITERKLAEEQMSLQLSALTAAANAIVITDRNGKIEWVNPSFTRVTGFSAGEAVGSYPSVQKSGQHPPGFYANLWATIVTGNVWHGEVINKRKDGRIYSEDMTITPVRGADGQIAHFVAIKQDVTEQRLLENHLRQVQKMEAIGQLAGGVAHDFNNILVVIQLHAGMLKTEPNLSLQQLESAGEIENAAQRAANLTRQLLLFSRKQALLLGDHDLNEVVTNITKMLQRILRENIQIHFKFSPKALLIHADAGMLDQVLMNLTVNACDAMPKGGRLIIETSATEFDEITAAQTAQGRPGAFACLSVTDTGCGIPLEILPRIFEPFFTTKEVGKGTGLGLATVFGIVQQHHGWINVYSEAGRGTTFRVYLPYLTQPADPKTNSGSLATICGGKETILLVEDERSVRASVQNVLLRLGYRVLEAPNGVEALQVWRQHRAEIRLLLTDLVMPGGMTGKELGEQLLQHDPQLKIVYISGYSAEIASKDFPLEEGVDFLTKPFEAGKLAQIVRKRLDGI